MALALALAQLNPTVGDVAGNAALRPARHATEAAARWRRSRRLFRAASWSATRRKIWCCGPRSSSAAAAALRELRARKRCRRAGPRRHACRGARTGGVHNAVALVADGRIELRFKHELPNYGVFDEKRVFAPGPLPEPVDFRGMRLGLPICEDIWFADVAAHLARAGRRAAARAERLAVRGREVRSSGCELVAARACARPGWRSPTSTRSAARTSSCSTAARSSSTRRRARACCLPFWRETRR